MHTLLIRPYTDRKDNRAPQESGFTRNNIGISGRIENDRNTVLVPDQTTSTSSIAWSKAAQPLKSSILLALDNFRAGRSSTSSLSPFGVTFKPLKHTSPQPDEESGLRETISLPTITVLNPITSDPATDVADMNPGSSRKRARESEGSDEIQADQSESLDPINGSVDSHRRKRQQIDIDDYSSAEEVGLALGFQSQDEVDGDSDSVHAAETVDAPETADLISPPDTPGIL